MKKSETSEQVITRRKALGRIGLFATAAYTVPAFATLSMAHASSNASSTSSASDGTSDASGSSDASGTSGASDTSGPSISVPSDVEALCSEGELASVAGDLTNPEYVQCLIDNGVDLGEGFVLPDGVTLG